MLDWSALRIVLNVHREGSLAAAAKVLGVSQPTLSRQLARTEEELGSRLFDRRQGRLVITEAGQIVARHAESIERQLRGMEDSIQGIGREMSGLLRISAPEQLFPFALADIVTEFQRLHPDIVFSIDVSNQMTDFSSGKIDVAFRAEENPKPSLWGRRIGRLDFGYFAHHTLIDATGGDVEAFCQSEDVPLIAHDGVTTSTEGDMRKRFPKGKIAMRSNNLESSITFSKQGIGVVWLPLFIGEKLDDLVCLEGLVAPSKRSLWALTHKDLRSVYRIERFINFMADRAKELGILSA